jgi:hypothetical protein
VDAYCFRIVAAKASYMQTVLDPGSRPVGRGQARTGVGRHIIGDRVDASIHSNSLWHARVIRR